ncbi:putative 1-phosphatidylinositol 3-phosphate 5-kinase FAB1 [Blattamonas nauphoetae]|uniref:1-phosphatidylinositol 3-phosphate 5-kinase FAB1 n=1 Tax=Blattamonas nauphoetae TaxID=2049346 RepID=A0ABQ9Y1P6_9EUKA|nr:putative 1-phosphatidylinositol 3-phosphate 5-kinase FAB1 [Blattamonas nauphoetae]
MSQCHRCGTRIGLLHRLVTCCICSQQFCTDCVNITQLNSEEHVTISEDPSDFHTLESFLADFNRELHQFTFESPLLPRPISQYPNISTVLFTVPNQAELDTSQHLTMSPALVDILMREGAREVLNPELYRTHFFQIVVKNQILHILSTLLSLLHLPLHWGHLLIDLVQQALRNEQQCHWFLGNKAESTSIPPLFTHVGSQSLGDMHRIIFRSVPGGFSAKEDSFIFDGVVMEVSTTSRNVHRMRGKNVKLALFRCRLDGLDLTKDITSSQTKPSNDEPLKESDLVWFDSTNPKHTSSTLMRFTSVLQSFEISLVLTTELVTFDVQEELELFGISIIVVTPQQLDLLAFSFNVPIVESISRLSHNHIAVCDWWKSVVVQDETAFSDPTFNRDLELPEQESDNDHEVEEVADEGYKPAQITDTTAWISDKNQHQAPGHISNGVPPPRTIGNLQNLISLPEHPSFSSNSKWMVFFNTSSLQRIQTICLRGAPHSVLKRAASVGRVGLQLARAGQSDVSLWTSLHFHPATFLHQRHVTVQFPYTTFNSMFPRQKANGPTQNGQTDSDNIPTAPIITHDDPGNPTEPPDNESAEDQSSYKKIKVKIAPTKEMHWMFNLYQCISHFDILRHLIQQLTDLSVDHNDFNSLSRHSSGVSNTNHVIDHSLRDFIMQDVLFPLGQENLDDHHILSALHSAATRNQTMDALELKQILGEPLPLYFGSLPQMSFIIRNSLENRWREESDKSASVCVVVPSATDGIQSTSTDEDLDSGKEIERESPHRQQDQSVDAEDDQTDSPSTFPETSPTFPETSPTVRYFPLKMRSAKFISVLPEIPKSDHLDTFEILGHRIDISVEASPSGTYNDSQTRVYLTPPSVASEALLNMPLARFLDVLFSCDYDRLIPYQYLERQVPLKKAEQPDACSLSHPFPHRAPSHRPSSQPDQTNRPGPPIIVQLSSDDYPTPAQPSIPLSCQSQKLAYSSGWYSNKPERIFTVTIEMLSPFDDPPLERKAHTVDVPRSPTGDSVHNSHAAEFPSQIQFPRQTSEDDIEEKGLNDSKDDLIKRDFSEQKQGKPKRSGLREVLKSDDLSFSMIIGCFPLFVEDFLRDDWQDVHQRKPMHILNRLRKVHISKEISKEVERIIAKELLDETTEFDRMRREIERKREEAKRLEEEKAARKREENIPPENLDQEQPLISPRDLPIEPFFFTHKPTFHSQAQIPISHSQIALVQSSSDQKDSNVQLKSVTSAPNLISSQTKQDIPHPLVVSVLFEGDRSDSSPLEPSLSWEDSPGMTFQRFPDDNVDPPLHQLGHTPNIGRSVNNLQDLSQSSQGSIHSNDQFKDGEKQWELSQLTLVVNKNPLISEQEEMEEVQEKLRDSRINRHNQMKLLIDRAVLFDSACRTLNKYLDSTSLPFSSLENLLQNRQISQPLRVDTFTEESESDSPPFVPFLLKEIQSKDSDHEPEDYDFIVDPNTQSGNQQDVTGEDDLHEEDSVESEEESESEKVLGDSQLLAGINPIWSSLPPLRSNLRTFVDSYHPCLPAGLNGEMILVDETEITSVVSFVLMSQGYLNCILRNAVRCVSAAQLLDEGVLFEEVHHISQEDELESSKDHLHPTDSTSYILRSSDDAQHRTDPVMKSSSTMKACLEHSIRDDYCCRFNDGKMQLSVTIHYSLQFHALRARTIGNYLFAHSLLRCSDLDVKGGKSNASFFKTGDQRFVIKQISGIEMKQLLDSAFDYFFHFSDTLYGDVGSLLLPIVSIITVQQISSDAVVNVPVGPKRHARYFVVMENQKYGQDFVISFDLKGSLRNRLVKDLFQHGGVLQDSNYIDMMFNWQMKLESRDWQKFMEFADRDSKFLSDLNVVDYSLLVGVGDNAPVIHVGIIDYIRQYTWDKQLESIVKKTGILGQGSIAPTIIRPSEYRQRFMDSLKRYFTQVPGRFEMCFGISPEAEIQPDTDSSEV